MSRAHASRAVGFLCTLHDALNRILRQDDYLIPFQRFAVDPGLVQVCVQNQPELFLFMNNRLHGNGLRFSFFTGFPYCSAPKVCVDFCERSVKVACVDGRKGWHNNTEPVRSRLSDERGGATRWAARPEKTDGSARGSRGLGPRKR